MSRISLLKKAKLRHRSNKKNKKSFANVRVVIMALALLCIIGFSIIYGANRFFDIDIISWIGDNLRNEEAGQDQKDAVETSSFTGLSSMFSISAADLMEGILPGAGIYDDNGRQMPKIEPLPVLASIGELITNSATVSPTKLITSQIVGRDEEAVEATASPAGTLYPARTTIEGLKPLVKISEWDPVIKPTIIVEGGGLSEPESDAERTVVASRPDTIGRPEVSAEKPRILTPTVSSDRYIYGDDPVIAIYHTHTSEAYEGSQGEEYLWGSTEGVVKVGEELAEKLWEDYGISAVQSQKVHDVPNFGQSYTQSAATITGLVRDFKDLQVVIDIHRDAVGGNGRQDNIVTVNGVDVAKVLILVTTDKYGLPHPNWRQNLDIADRIQDMFNKLYPGVCKGVQIRNDARFNQHIHPGCILMEIGDVSNNRQDALNSADLIAEVLSSVVSPRGPVPR